MHIAQSLCHTSRCRFGRRNSASLYFLPFCSPGWLDIQAAGASGESQDLRHLTRGPASVQQHEYYRVCSAAAVHSSLDSSFIILHLAWCIAVGKGMPLSFCVRLAACSATFICKCLPACLLPTCRRAGVRRRTYIRTCIWVQVHIPWTCMAGPLA